MSRADRTHRLSADRATLSGVNRLLDDVLHDPFGGIGTSEPLRHALPGSWSRRISEELRLVQLANGEDVVVLRARHHYR